MKKALVLLFALCLVFSFCACGSAKQTAEPAQPEESPAAAEETAAPVEPGKNYVEKDESLLVKKTVHGEGQNGRYQQYSFTVHGRILDEVTSYNYDEYGNLLGEDVKLVLPETTLEENYTYLLYGDEEEAQEYLTYTYDDSGELAEVLGEIEYRPELMIECRFDDGLMVGREVYLTEIGPEEGTVESYRYAYDTNGQVVSVEKTTYGDLYYGKYNTPMTDRYELDRGGWLTLWHHTEEGLESNAVYRYDDAGNLVSMNSEENGETTELTVENDADGKPVSAEETHPDGSATAYTFSYDEEGRLIARESVGKSGKVSITMAYDPEDGYLSAMNKTGKAKTVYQHKKGTTTMIMDGVESVNNGVRVSFSDSRFPEDKVFGGAYQFSFEDSADHDYRDVLGFTEQYEYRLRAMGTEIRYTETVTQYDYETRTILTEAG